MLVGIGEVFGFVGFGGVVGVLITVIVFFFIVGVGIFEGFDELGIELAESTAERVEQGLAAEGASEFLFSHGKSLGHDLCEISEGMSGLWIDLATGNGTE